MCLTDLGRPLRLIADYIESRADGIRVAGLQSVFMFHADKQFVVVGQVLIVTAHIENIVRVRRKATSNLHGAGISSPEGRSIQCGDVAASPSCDGHRARLRYG